VLMEGHCSRRRKKTNTERRTGTGMRNDDGVTANRRCTLRF